jgi:hypothetical protein
MGVSLSSQTINVPLVDRYYRTLNSSSASTLEIGTNQRCAILHTRVSSASYHAFQVFGVPYSASDVTTTREMPFRIWPIVVNILGPSYIT